MNDCDFLAPQKSTGGCWCVVHTCFSHDEKLIEKAKKGLGKTSEFKCPKAIEKSENRGTTEPISIGYWDGVGLVEKPTESRGFVIPPRPTED